MPALAQLWLPILLSAVAVFIVSSLIHMVFKWHAADYRPLANEDEVRAAIRAGNPTPGHFVLPHCGSMQEMGSDAMRRKYAEGPVGYLTLRPNGAPAIGASLGQWFLLSLVVSAIAGAVGAQAATSGAGTAVAVVATVAFVAYGFGSVQEGIWQGRRWSSVAKYVLDAALYSAATAGVFAWLGR